MKTGFSMTGLALLAFCAWQCRALLNAWQHAPFDHFGWVALAIWIVPAVARDFGRRADDTLLLIAAGCSFAGAAADLNVLKYAGLAASLAALTPPPRRTAPWMLGALAWMPVFGWLGSSLGPRWIVVARICIATVAASSAWLRVGERRRATL
jgi:hypothetical protein